MENPHLPVRACKLLQFTERSIGPRMEICVYSGLPITMVPCLHQSNVYLKRKLRGWRAQKCIPLVDAKTVLPCAGQQITPVHGAQYRADNGNLCIFWFTYRHGTVFAPKQCLYQKIAKGMESQKMYFSNRCKNRAYLYRGFNLPRFM